MPDSSDVSGTYVPEDVSGEGTLNDSRELHWTSARIRHSRVGIPLHLREERRWLNPFTAKLSEHREHLYLFDDFDADRQRLLSACGSSELEREVWIELGSGSGANLIQQAKCHPEKLHLGFELRYKRAVRTIEKAKSAGLTNIICARTDARLFGEIVSGLFVTRLSIYFPDPWPKARWIKHRLLSRELFIHLRRVFADGAILSIKTDHSAMFESFLRIADQFPDFRCERVVRDLHGSPPGETQEARRTEHGALSEFEQMFNAKGVCVSFAEFSFVRRNAE